MSFRDAESNCARLHVGIVTTSFPVTGNEASGVFVERLVSHLPETVMATVLIPCPSTRLSRRPDAPYRLLCFAYGPRAWLRLAHQPGGIPDALRRRDPAILLLPLLLPAMFMACLRLAGRVDILHGNWSVPGLITAIAGRLRGRVAIVTLRGEDITRAESSRLFRWILGACIALNHRTVVVSETMYEVLRRRFPKHAKRLEFIPNGVSTMEARPRVGFHSPLRLVVVASLIQRKRIETLIEAVSILRPTLDLILRIVGDGTQRGHLESVAESLGVKDHVEFLGGVSPEMVRHHLRWADIFVFASESEGRPNVILEAMASGLPIVAADIPGVRELVGSDAGLLFPVGDASALARSIATLLEDPDRARRLARKAKERIEQSDLTWEATGHRYAAAYFAAVKEKRAPTCAD